MRGRIRTAETTGDTRQRANDEKGAMSMRALSQLQGLPINGPGSRARKVDISSPYAWAAAVLLCSGLVCGVSAATTHPNNCTANCSHQSNASMRSESSLHVSNMQVCGSNQICRATEP